MDSFSAYEAKQNFGEVMDRAREEGVITITKHGRPSVAVISDTVLQEYLQLKRDRLKADVALGFAQVERGEYITLNSEAERQTFWNGVKERVRTRLAQEAK